MKKLNKNILFGLGALGAVVAPIATVVACGDSKGDGGAKTGTPAITGNNGGNNSGNNSGNNNPVVAQNQASNVLDLAAASNQFEAGTILGNLTGMSLLKNIAEKFVPLGDGTTTDIDGRKLAWDDALAKFNTYLSSHASDETITIKNGTSSYDFKLNLRDHFTKIVAALNVDKATKSAIDMHGGSAVMAGMPIMQGVGTATMINVLTNYNIQFGMNALMKLTHLPEAAFNEFKLMLEDMQVQFIKLIKSDVFKTWASKLNMLRTDVGDATKLIALTQVKGQVDQFSPNHGLTDEEITNMTFSSIFIVNALQQ